jgi:hypothetical protein
MDRLAEETLIALGNLTAFDEFIRASTDPVFGATKALDDYMAAQKVLRRTTDKTSDKAVKALKDQADALSRLAGSLGELGPAWEDEFRAIAESMDAPEELIASIIQQVEDAKDLKVRIAVELIPFIVRDLIGLVDPASGDIPGIPIPLPPIEIDNLLAHGGPAAAGRPYIVGEQGPELFIPNQSGTVMPNGGFGGNVNVDVTLEVTESVADAELLARDTVRAIRDELERIGSEVA